MRRLLQGVAVQEDTASSKRKRTSRGHKPETLTLRWGSGAGRRGLGLRVN